MSRELAQRLITLRRNHPAWLLLASPKGPLILASLKTLVDAQTEGIDFDEAVERLAGVMADNANDNEFDFGDEPSLAARRELRQWIKRGLIVERGGRLLVTDALQRSLQFLDLLEDQPMTSTASRLATVQRAIEILEAQLSRSQTGRETSLKVRIELLQKELADVQEGRFEVLDGPQAEEGIREVYQLAISLHADFHRVEDSYREADQTLRHHIVSQRQNRGEIVNQLLNGHDALIQTAEGQVFESFHAQLAKTVELEEMKARLRSILDNRNADKALQRKQKSDLRQLVWRLVQESEQVIQARARSERDVRSFLKSGLADEQIRVGAILQEIFDAAYQVDWQSQRVRRMTGPLPPIAPSLANLPLAERLLVKQVGEDDSADLDLTASEVDPTQMDAEFWQAWQALDREQLFKATLAQLQSAGKPLTLGELAEALPPTHDLETLAYWLLMARQSGISIDGQVETIDLQSESEGWTRFLVPSVGLGYGAISGLEPGNLE